jgi:DNA helicase-2/ATP-dependent DNA helicase PcrA
LHVPHYLRELNPEQRAAALAIQGPVLILAGAGSGKTRTLVYRIVHLLEQGIDPRQILAVTFTNRAAAEMRERVGSVIGKAARGLTLSTFHSLGARILRDHAERVSLPKKFSIYATGDQLSLVKRIITEEVHVVATAGEDAYDAKRVLYTISSWKNRMIGPEEAGREVAAGRMRENRSDDYAVLAAAVYPRYEASLRAAGACDFDDLLLLPVRLLRDHIEVRDACWKRWHYLMVDEYQDTNGAQLEMARLMAGPGRNLCVVGDDDQSIYAWRGADLRNILDFERHFPGAQVVILEENYRSTQRILDAANAVIAHNRARKPKVMRTGNGVGPRIDYWEFGEEEGRSAEEREAAMVASEIGIRRFREQLQWGDFSVLYRTNLQSKVLEEAMRAANVPYRVIGGTSYFDRKEIADAAAYLRVVVNPADEISLRRIVNYPTRGVGRTTLMKLVDAARAQGVSLWQAMAAGGVEGVGAAPAEAVRRFVDILSTAHRQLAETEAALASGAQTELSLESWAADFLQRVRLEEAIRAENRSEKVAEARLGNLRDFVSSIGLYERRVRAEAPLPDEEDDWSPPTLAGFLERVSLVNEEEPGKDEEKDAASHLVTPMTLHSAKGLEFPHVFLVGLEEEILPHARSVSEVAEGADDPVAEERRLFYVGLTRARHRLTLSACRTRRRGGEPIPRQPSRFLKELPQELLEVRASAAESSLTVDESQELRGNFFASMRAMLE